MSNSSRRTHGKSRRPRTKGSLAAHEHYENTHRKARMEAVTSTRLESVLKCWLDSEAELDSQP